MMYKSLNHHYHHLILIIILCILNVYGQFVPESRVGHSAVYVESERRIYYIGGFKSIPTEPETMSDFFYLDVNIPNLSNLNYLTFSDLKSQVNLPLSIFHISELGGVNKDLIFILEGVHWNDSETNYIYSFNTKTNELSVPIVQGKVPPTRKGISSVIYEGKIYLFGGHNGADVDALYYNNFDVFDTINLNWQVGSLINSPVTRTLYSAILVNGIIYYIGGKTQVNVYTPLTEIYQYDVVGNTWSLKKATAADPMIMPGSRAGHTSILMDGKIIIYGGFFSSDVTPYNLPAKETIAMLDVNTLVWSIPAFDLRENNPIPKLAFHTATAVNTIMFIAFGNFTDKPNRIDQTNKIIYAFLFGKSQISSYPLLVFGQTNETQLQLPTSTNTNINPQQSLLSKVVIIGISIGSVSIVLIILAALSIAYKRAKKNKLQLGVPNDQNSLNGVQINDDKYHSEYQK